MSAILIMAIGATCFWTGVVFQERKGAKNDWFDRVLMAISLGSIIIICANEICQSVMRVLAGGT